MAKNGHVWQSVEMDVSMMEKVRGAGECKLRVIELPGTGVRASRGTNVRAHEEPVDAGGRSWLVRTFVS